MTKTSFESLPNEILAECWKYLHGLDLFYTFNQLNLRLNQSIRCVRLGLTFQNTISLKEFQWFCMTMSTNPEIKNQIYSLELSNENLCQIHVFLSHFQLTEFIHLQSLTLINIDHSSRHQLEPILPFLSQLKTFRLIDCANDKNESLLSVLPLGQLQTLVVPIFQWDNQDLSSITHLTVFSCTDNILHQILSFLSNLRYLCIHRLEHVNVNATYTINNVKQLIIKTAFNEYEDFVDLFQRTPSIESLTLCSILEETRIDVEQWENLIRSSLTNLRKFEFAFQYQYEDKDETQQELKRFETDFWVKEHNWFSEYLIINDTTILLYTIPYCMNDFGLPDKRLLYSNKMINRNHVYNRVKTLIVEANITDGGPFYFPNVAALRLSPMTTFDTELILTDEYVQSLNNIIRFRNLNHLYIDSNWKIGTSNAFLDILKNAPQLSSLAGDLYCLIPFFDNEELCSYLTKMIKKIDLDRIYCKFINESYQTNRLWTIFRNITHIKCYIYVQGLILFLVQHLSNLVRFDFNIKVFDSWWAKTEMEQVCQLDMKILVDIHKDQLDDGTLYIIERSLKTTN